MRVALIVNPFAAGKKAEQLVPDFEQDLANRHIDCHTFTSRYHGHSTQLASHLKIEAYDAILAMGGDGTNFQVLNGLLSAFPPEKIPPMGIIPVGSGNSFARDLNILSLEDGLNAILANNPKWVDVCSFTQGRKIIYFVNLAGLGFVTDVAKTARRFKIFRDFSYLIGVFVRTINLKFHHMELEIDGKVLSGDNCFVEFCNSRFTGGKMMIAPDARIDDGFMDIVVADKLSRTSLLAALPRLYTGTHIHHPAVRCFKARQAIIKTRPPKTLLPDGEILGTTPATVTVLPKLIRYLT